MIAKPIQFETSHEATSTARPIRHFKKKWTYLVLIGIALLAGTAGLIAFLVLGKSSANQNPGSPASSQANQENGSASLQPTAAPTFSSTPAPTFGYTSAPTSGSTPVPSSGVTPAPTSGSTPAPTSGSTPAPTSGSTPAPTSGATPAPTSGSTPAPTSGATPVPTQGTNPGPIYPVGLTEFELQYQNTTRRMRVYVPPILGMNTTKAVVVVLHGGGGTGLDVSNIGQHPLSVFRNVSDREGFVVVYPEGSLAKDGKLGWTDCRSDNLQASGEDDIGFLRYVISLVRANLSMPVSRTFLAGTSNGGQMTLAFSMYAAAEVAAIAPDHANLPKSPLPGACTLGPSRPLPVMLGHATSDPAMPFGGGCVANVGGGCARGEVISAEATRDYFLQLNGLSAVVPVVTPMPNINLNDNSTVERYDYAGTVPLRWWKLIDAGHPPASLTVKVSASDMNGIQNRDIEFAEQAWTFFNSFLPQ